MQKSSEIFFIFQFWGTRSFFGGNSLTKSKDDSKGPFGKKSSTFFSILSYRIFSADSKYILDYGILDYGILDYGILDYGLLVCV